MIVNTVRDIGNAVRGRREDLGLSQAQLATRVGVSRSWINEVEAGKPTVEFVRVLRLLEVVGLSLELVRTPSPDVGSSGVNLDAVLSKYLRR